MQSRNLCNHVERLHEYDLAACKIVPDMNMREFCKNDGCYKRIMAENGPQSLNFISRQYW